MSHDRFLSPLVSPGDMKRSFVSRAGFKLDAAILTFQIPLANRIAADLGANVGGFTDCLLQHGAAKVYAVDTAYGVLAWTLRKDPRVIVRERANALHVAFPEKIGVAVVDVGWTKQEKILPHVRTLLDPDNPSADVLTLIKPHYESAEAARQKGVLTLEQSSAVLNTVLDRIAEMGWKIHGVIKTPIEGQKGNAEFVAWLRPPPTTSASTDIPPSIG